MMGIKQNVVGWRWKDINTDNVPIGEKDAIDKLADWYQMMLQKLLEWGLHCSHVATWMVWFGN